MRSQTDVSGAGMGTGTARAEGSWQGALRERALLNDTRSPEGDPGRVRTGINHT